MTKIIFWIFLNFLKSSLENQKQRISTLNSEIQQVEREIYTLLGRMNKSSNSDPHLNSQDSLRLSAQNNSLHSEVNYLQERMRSLARVPKENMDESLGISREIDDRLRDIELNIREMRNLAVFKR